ncbi:thermonuclease family protein [Ruegeria arenilitoris]|uniref:thermonuclease family protein n=1 Tax=Ruegeria arenilitoris TaxID=1173585 RepID=UPI00148032EF|nr:thermonuclease family protein [Ruegeria arenilitoris]
MSLSFTAPGHVLNALFFCFLFLASPSASQTITGIPSVIDGDTIEINGTHLRLHGIDAPEASQLCQRPNGEQWRCGQRAALALDQFIGARLLNCKANTVDRYGRFVTVCHAGITDIGRWMVQQGWAMAYLEYSTDYAQDQLSAMRGKKNIWSGYVQEPWEWRREDTEHPKLNAHRGFCYTAQMWLPEVLEYVEASGTAICEAGGGEFCGDVTSIGQGICKAAGGEFCGTVTNLGQGICKAARGEFCGTVTNLGQGICKAAGGEFCGTVTNLGQGICKAAGGEFCGSVTNVGQGICKASGGEFCGAVTNIGQGICKASGGEFCDTTTSLEAAVCAELGTCKTNQFRDVLASILDACGTEVLSFGISNRAAYP